MIKRGYVFAVLSLTFAAAPCLADIYKFVDAQGGVHFTNVRVDSRYQLFMKETPRVTEQAVGLQAAVAPTAKAAAPRFGAVVPASGKHFVPPTQKHYVDIIAKVAREQQMDPALIHAVVTVESAYNPRAKSRVGAGGLMQLMPDTAKRYGVSNVWDPVENGRGGARYLRDLLAMFNNNLNLAVAAYNAGEGAVIRSGRAIPRYAETQAYVPKVLQYYQQYRGAFRAA
jgi:soluble lytic murein transglycosylase-like protein